MNAPLPNLPDGQSTGETDNPLGGTFHFNLLVPDIEVRMVNASSLEDYELWLFAASLAASALVGFIVAYVQSFATVNGVSKSDTEYLVMAVGCGILLLVFVIRAIVLRTRLAKEAQTYRMQATRTVNGG